MLRNLKVGTKLLLGFGVVMALAIAMGTLAITRMSGVGDIATKLSDQHAPTAKLANEVERNSLLTMYAMRGYGITGEENYLENGQANLKKIRESLKGCEDLAQKQSIKSLADASKNATTAVDTYADLVKQTQQEFAKLDNLRARMDASATAFMENCNTYLKNQNEKLKSEIAEGADAAKLSERHDKITWANELIELGNACRIANFKAQALREPSIADQAMGNFDKMAAVVSQTRTKTVQASNLEQLDRIMAAANAYKGAMTEASACNKLLAEIASKRGTAGDAVLDIAQKTSVEAIEQTAKGAADSTSALSAASLVMVIGLVVMVLVGAGVAVLIARAMTKPIHALVARIKDIAQGEGDLTQRVDITTKDELGELGTWFNTFVQKIHDVIREVAKSAADVASASTEIAASSEQMASGMTEQNSQVSQISSAIEEMSASVVEVARKSNEAAGSAANSGTVAEEGGGVVTKTIEGMKAINDAVSASAASVQELGKRGEQIGQIIAVINDIADQTNLLALNAAIEAARAGEHGRGFAVVADEVRKLADRTTKATEEIAGSIQAIQTETTGAVQRMNTGTEQVKLGVQLATGAGDSLKKIVASARDVAAMIQSIAAATEEQSAASEQVSRNVESISAVAKQTSEGASQAANAAAQLSDKAEQLQRLVGQFKLAAYEGSTARKAA